MFSQAFVILSAGGGGRGACVVEERGNACVAVGACMAGEMATAADGTHPTGMHSCFYFFGDKRVPRSTPGARMKAIQITHWWIHDFPGVGGTNPKGGADVNAVNQHVHTATLLLAARRNHGYVDMQLKSGADMNLLLEK